MRLALATYNPVKECKNCSMRDENLVSAHILSFQTAAQLLQRFGGSWNTDGEGIELHLAGIENSLQFDLATGTVRNGTVMTQLGPRYTPDKGILALTDELCADLALPKTEGGVPLDPVFTLFLKLVEIFHARCGLRIIRVDSANGLGTWELRLEADGLSGWIGSDGYAHNRFGESIDLNIWQNLRPEKAATYIFGFNQFCRHYPNPLQPEKN